MEKKILISYLLFFPSLFVSCLFSTPTIHVFGDSHASFCFRERETIVENDSLTFVFETTQQEFLFKITSFIGTTMHRIGRDNLSFLNISKHGVKNGDIAVYVFGEVDVRCHVGKQRDQSKRNLKEVIDTLAGNYIHAVCLNQAQFKNLTSVVVSIVPPIEGKGRTSDTYPFYGTLDDRICITQTLNTRLKELCILNKLLFLDIYSLFATKDGSLDPYYADHAVHINHLHNKVIKNRLITLIT